MRLLLDTHILLWALVTPDRLPADARDALEDPANTVYFSAANIWEIAIKRALERPDFTVEPDQVRTAAAGHGRCCGGGIRLGDMADWRGYSGQQLKSANSLIHQQKEVAANHQRDHIQNDQDGHNSPWTP